MRGTSNESERSAGRRAARLWAAARSVAIAWLAVSAGCDTQPIKDEKVNLVLSGCCDAARARVELAADEETRKFRDRCGSCKVGKSKCDCEAAARRVLIAVTTAYSSDILPAECSTLRAQLGELGISFQAVP